MLRTIVRFIAKPILKLIFKIEVRGQENFLSDGPFVLVANHKSMLDVIVLFLVFDRKMYFMAKKELFKFKPFGYILKLLGAFPVDRNSNDLKAVKNSMKVLKNGDVLGIFPEGHRNESVDSDNAKAGAVMIAAKCKVPLVAAAIKSDYKFRSKVEIVLESPYYFDTDKKYTTEDYKEITRHIVGKIKFITEN